MTNISHNLLNKVTPKVSKAVFGEVDGQEVQIISVGFEGGISAAFTNYGGILQRLQVPNQFGQLTHVIKGFNNLNSYQADPYYNGAIVGRYANRIKEGKFTLNGKSYQLSINQSPNHLHGGIKGFNKVVWQLKSIEQREDEVVCTLFYLSKDGEEGYPGNVSITAKYIFTSQSFKVVYEAETDQDTPFNLTHHGYFNLNGLGVASVENHFLTLPANDYLEVGASQIPIKTTSVEKNPAFDFRASKSIQKGLEQLKSGTFDHCFVLNPNNPLVSMYSPKSGIRIDINTNQQGLQFYIPQDRQTLCLEPQYFPDGPNRADSEDAILRKGQKYEFWAHYQFKTI